MAANALPVRYGTNTGNVPADAWELFLKEFGGEVLTAFSEKNVFAPAFMVRQLNGAKSAQFPIFGKGTEEYHTPGAFIQGSDVPTTERLIPLDEKMLIAPRFIANIDDLVSHYDARGPLSRDIGMRLARREDLNVAATLLKAARVSAATAKVGGGGAAVTHADMLTSATRLITSLITAARILDEKDVPEEDRVAFIAPAMYEAIIQSGDTRIFDERTNGGEANGGAVSGKVYKVSNIQIVKSNNMPRTNLVASPGGALEKYRVDASKTAAIVAQKTAIGTVRASGIVLETEYSAARQGWLMIGKMLTGHDYLRPEAVVELAVP